MNTPPPRSGTPRSGALRSGLARVERQRLSMIWIVPIVAAGIGIWLAWHTLAQRGPMITVSFATGDGLIADQTPVKYKAVQLGMVESVALSKDMTHVVVRLRMRAEAADRLTQHARFWVVRPRFSQGAISGLETLVSGAYIAMDPGPPGGAPERRFAGLENPPGWRSDEPGTPFILKARTVGGLGSGSPVFYRDIPVGEVLGYDPPGLDDTIAIHLFIRAPYDSLVREDTRFWNASGVRVEAGASGLQVQLESLQAVLSGGVAFITPPDARTERPAKLNAVFPLFRDENEAIAATSKDRILVVSYFTSPVVGLSKGAAVEINGMRVGSVTRIQLEFDPAAQDVRVAVHMAIEPDSVAFDNSSGQPARRRAVRAWLEDYLRRAPRAALRTASYLTGAAVMTLALTDDPHPPSPRFENGEIVLPGRPGGVDALIGSIGDLAAKLNRLPLDSMQSRVTHILASVDQIVSDPAMRMMGPRALKTLASLQTLAHDAESGLQPVLRHADTALGPAGYGRGSLFYGNLDALMNQAVETLRAVRALADFLNRHPEALILGRGRGGG